MTDDVLVTGGAGFIGFHISRALAEEDYQVTICDNFSRGELDDEVDSLIKQPNVRLVKCDLRDSEALDSLGRFDQVYHLAAVQGTERFYDDPKTVIRTNLLTTINVLDWFVESGSGKLLFSSSSETYAGTINRYGEPIPTPENVLLSIEDVHNPRWSYGGSKIAGELLLAAYGRTHDLDYRIVRYHNIYGPRMGTDHVIPEFILRALDRTDPFPVYGSTPTRAFCYVDDAVRASRSLMESDTEGNIYHVGNDEEEIEIGELVEKVLAIVGHDAELDVLPAPKGSVMRRCPDITKLRSHGYVPEVPLEEGLPRTVAWYRERMSN